MRHHLNIVTLLHRHLSLAAAFCLASAAPAIAAFLPAAGALPQAVNVIDPQTASTHIVRNYVGGLQNWMQNVNRPDGNGEQVGTLEFDFAGYTGRRAADPAAGADTIGGAAIRGGFKFKDGFSLKQGYNLRWLQTYIDQVPGQPDLSVVDGNPYYPDFPIAGINAALYDVPFDLLNRNIRVSFQSALVAYDNANPNNVKYLGSFLWAYSINAGVVTPEAPSFWQDVTPNFLATVAAAYPNLNLMYSSTCIIPSPGAIALLSIAGLSAARRVRRSAA